MCDSCIFHNDRTIFAAKTVFEKTSFFSIWFKLTVVERQYDFDGNQILDLFCMLSCDKPWQRMQRTSSTSTRTLLRCGTDMTWHLVGPYLGPTHRLESAYDLWYKIHVKS